MTHRYEGKPFTLGTIYFDAKSAGWSYPVDQFEPVDVSAEGGELSHPEERQPTHSESGPDTNEASTACRRCHSCPAG